MSATFQPNPKALAAWIEMAADVVRLIRGSDYQWAKRQIEEFDAKVAAGEFEDDA